MPEYKYPKTSIRKVPIISRNKKASKKYSNHLWLILTSDSNSPYYAVNYVYIPWLLFSTNQTVWLRKRTTKKTNFFPTISNMVKIRFHHLEYDAVTFTVICRNCKSIDLEHWLLITLIDTHSVLYVQGFFHIILLAKLFSCSFSCRPFFLLFVFH